MSKKQTSIYFEEELIEVIKTRSDKENLKMNDFVVTAVERQLLYPFFSWRHLQNYTTILKQVRFPKNENSNRKALFYIIAYDGILTEYIDKLYKIEGKQEVVNIPEDLDDMLHPDFDLMEAGIELFSSGSISDMENALDWFYEDKNEMQVVLNAVLIAKDVVPIKDELYRLGQASMFPQLDAIKEYNIQTFEKSLFYKQCNDSSRDLLKQLFCFIREKEMEVSINLGQKDAFTFSLNTMNNKRLAIISLANDLSSLRIGINKLLSNAGGTISLCRVKYDLQELVYDDLMAKYKELTNI